MKLRWEWRAENPPPVQKQSVGVVLWIIWLHSAGMFSASSSQQTKLWFSLNNLKELFWVFFIVCVCVCLCPDAGLRMQPAGVLFILSVTLSAAQKQKTTQKAEWDYKNEGKYIYIQIHTLLNGSASILWVICRWTSVSSSSNLSQFAIRCSFFLEVYVT